MLQYLPLPPPKKKKKNGIHLLNNKKKTSESKIIHSATSSQLPHSATQMWLSWENGSVACSLLCFRAFGSIYPYFSWIIPPGRSQVVRANQPPICFSHVHGHLEEVPQPDPERERLLNIKHGEYKPLTTYSNWDDPPSVRAILLMEEILHHLRCTKHYKIYV